MLRPLPEQLGPLKLGVVYLAAAAEARVGGDLYEVVATNEHGIRMIIGDVRGKGLEAVEVAADIIGRFRELAYSVHTLDEIAYRLDAGLTRRWGKHEEFVTALLAEIDPERGKLTILNCGHPPPILISPEDGVTVLEVPRSPPRRSSASSGSAATPGKRSRSTPSSRTTKLLLYTDGVTEARDASDGEFYPLDERVRALGVAAGAAQADGKDRARSAPTAPRRARSTWSATTCCGTSARRSDDDAALLACPRARPRGRVCPVPSASSRPRVRQRGRQTITRTVIRRETPPADPAGYGDWTDGARVSTFEVPSLRGNSEQRLR